MINTIHIVEEYRDYQIKNPKTFTKSHSKYLKTRSKLFLNGKQETVEVLSVMHQQLEQVEETWYFTCDIKLKVIEEEDVGQEE